MESHEFFKEIIENLEDQRVIELMKALGVENYKDTEAALIFPTICHNEDPATASLKLYYYKNSHYFYCYTSCGSMSIFKFLEHYYETRNIRYNWHTDILQVVQNCSKTSPQTIRLPELYKSKREQYELRQPPKELEVYPNGVLDVFQHYYPVEWLNDSISREAMDKYKILFSTSQNKIIIPHFDVNGRLIGIRGRALDPWEIENLGKYMPVQIENKWYSHPLSLNLYGLNFNKDEIRRQGYCFVFEAEKSVMQLESFQMPHVGVASCGSNFNKFQVNLLMRTCAPKEIILCYDREETEGSQEYFNKLYEMCRKYRNYAQMSFVYDRRGITRMKDSPTDRGEKIFKQLINERIKVK